MRFQEKVALVTGASHGIGRTTAKLLSKEGAKLLIHGRDADSLSKLAAELKTPVEIVTGDLCDKASIERLSKTAANAFGRIDILINNAGGGDAAQPFHLRPEEDVSRIFRINLEAVFLLTQKIIPTMLEQNYGRIVNVTSLAGRKSSPLSTADYASSKAAITGLTRQLAQEYASHGLTINAVAPGVVLSERIQRRWESLDEKKRKAILEKIPMGRAATLEEVARPILFLASDEASYMTGITLDVNGGAYMN